MSKVNPYDLSEIRREAERATVSTQRRYVKILDPNLLSLGDSLAEAAREAFDFLIAQNHHGEGCPCLKLRGSLGAWDAARKRTR